MAFLRGISGTVGVKTDPTAGQTVTFEADDKSLTRSAGSWTADGYYVGLVFTIADTTSNNGTFTVATAGTTVLTVYTAIVDEVGADPTITPVTTEVALLPKASWTRVFIKNTHGANTLEVRVGSGITGNILAAGASTTIEADPFTVKTPLYLVGSTVGTTYVGHWVCA